MNIIKEILYKIMFNQLLRDFYPWKVECKLEEFKLRLYLLLIAQKM